MIKNLSRSEKVKNISKTISLTFSDVDLLTSNFNN